MFSHRRKAPGDSTYAFSSVKMAEIVDGVPFWCEEMRCGPGVVDEGRGESMVHDMKLCAPNSRNMINHLPYMYEELATRRNATLCRDKMPVLPHRLDDAKDEILAPCMFARNTHLGDNWHDFTLRWSPRYSTQWRQHTDPRGAKAYKFFVGHDRQRAYVHCICGAPEHYLLAFAEWTACE
jgi:hypothetical protein